MPDYSQFNIDRTYPRLDNHLQQPGDQHVCSHNDCRIGLMTDLEADPSVKVVCSSRRIPFFSSPISTSPRQRKGRRCWAFGGSLFRA